MAASIDARDIWLKFDILFVRQEISLRRYLIQKLDERRNAHLDRNMEAQDKRTFWALRGINLQVEPGEVIGLIGSNGAGKSTLLMTLAGIYHPDRGSVTVNGKVGTLLSLGAGFNTEMSGIENIYQAGIFMGLSSDYIDEHLQEIVQMADIGAFINAPIRTYSSGMRARLGFAIAMHINPDIILLDEVLETGDQAFRQKSGNLLEIFREQGKTIIIASHNMASLNKFASRVIWMEHGTIVADGFPDEVTKGYQGAK